MTLKQTYSPEGLREFIEARSSHTHGGHLTYKGPQTVQCNFREMAVPRAWWLLSGKDIPPGQFLLNTCGHIACIECDHWSLSHSPHTVTDRPASAPPGTEVKRLRARLRTVLRESRKLQ